MEGLEGYGLIGTVVGIIADTPDQPIQLKTFCCRLSADFAALSAEEREWQPLPIIHPEVTDDLLNATFLRVRTEIKELVQSERDRLSTSEELRHLLIL